MAGSDTSATSGTLVKGRRFQRVENVDVTPEPQLLRELGFLFVRSASIHMRFRQDRTEFVQQ
jgi:hypothetical protein